jgi:hypothetical protein
MHEYIFVSRVLTLLSIQMIKVHYTENYESVTFNVPSLSDFS